MSGAVYLDYAATTSLDQEILAKMTPYMGPDYGNASGSHSFARKSATALTRARRELANLLGVEAKELIFTSGGSESNNLALRGVALACKREGKGNHIVSSRLEHPSVTKTLLDLEEHHGFEVDWIRILPSGQIDLEHLSQCLKPETILASFMLVNNETGILQEIAPLAAILQERGILFHCDCSQATQTIELKPKSLGMDLMSLSSHKFYGPKGMGLLYKSKEIPMVPLITGGSQEEAFRAGTENLAGIIGMTEALNRSQRRLEEGRIHFSRLRERLLAQIEERGLKVEWIGQNRDSAPHINCFLVQGAKADDLLMQLDLKGIACSSGSACSTGNAKASEVLLALGIEEERALGALRLSFGKQTTSHEIDLAVKALAEILEAA